MDLKSPSEIGSSVTRYSVGGREGECYVYLDADEPDGGGSS